MSLAPNIRQLYDRVWDEADYVVPPAENGAFFVTTNVVITPNQTWGHCPEVSVVANLILKAKVFFSHGYQMNIWYLTRRQTSEVLTDIDIANNA